MSRPFRQSSQPIAPGTHIAPDDRYNLYPAYPLAAGGIELGFPALAQCLATHPRIIIDGIGGVLWEDFRQRLIKALAELGVAFDWIDVSQALLPVPEVDKLVAPYLGGDDPLFGTRNTGRLGDFFNATKLLELRHRADSSERTLLYGTGAALVSREGFLVYAEVPKNEIQFRSRAGIITNLGASKPTSPKEMYKRFFFADWPPLRTHQAWMLPHLDLVLDCQRPDEPALISGNDLRSALSRAARSWFRARPWFEPGPWGGQWMKHRFPGVSPEAPNLAWSFELISPENGIVFESWGRRLEVTLDFLMFQEAPAVLGRFSQRFGHEFPIRFDYLDTFEGGNLSLQCHPQPAYAWRHFGERFTQDETYYITDCQPGAQVFLGFKEGVNAEEFERALGASCRQPNPLDVDRFIQAHPSQKHGLYLIPNGTIHCSGRNNLVLEISATPYIFTFKMYDWMRSDLDGRPRPLNIQRAMENLRFDRQGPRIQQEFIARPCVLSKGPDWELVHVPTHSEHFYDVHRFDFSSSVKAQTEGSPHVLNVVEGQSVILETHSAPPMRFAFAETFVVPAATDTYRLRSPAGRPVKVVKAFLKPNAQHIPEYLS